ncbi:MAG: hypothetical protein KDD42_08740 [Bdellovibrionales bacterium]|nr:hypothetical protein [Bdellovibrionales bacterium]
MPKFLSYFSLVMATLCSALLGVATAAGPDGIRAADISVGSGSAQTALMLSQIKRGEPRAALRGQNLAALRLEQVDLTFGNNGDVKLKSFPKLKTTVSGSLAALSQSRNVVFFSIDPNLQKFAESLVAQVRSPHVAVVAMDPTNGKVLAVAQKSNSIPSLALHAGFPAASLFKLVTSAAALERGAISPSSEIAFRGGTYTLEKWNYKPDRKRDNRHMNVAEALGRSCNPVFARIALNHLSPYLLRFYANTFGFNSQIDFDLPLSKSSAVIPSDDYGLSRTAAGFGAVKISPIHAAALMSGLANKGLVPRPILVNNVINSQGTTLYRAETEMIRRLTRAETSLKLLEMMEQTTTIGTSRKEFMVGKKPLLKDVRVAAKTGTLRGASPKGINNWFIAAAPIEDPKIAVSVVVVDPQHISTRASRLGRQMIQRFLGT